MLNCVACCMKTRHGGDSKYDYYLVYLVKECRTFNKAFVFYILHIEQRFIYILLST